MFKCKICSIELKRGSGHIKAKHHISTLEYISEYEGIDCCAMYDEGYSAQQIADFIKEKRLGVRPIKKDVLDYLRSKRVEIRNTSAATKVWIQKAGGPWNKGKTKEDHPGIMKYAESRRGKNNPYYKQTEEAKAKTRYWEYKSEEELADIRRRVGETLKKKYRTGELVPYAVLNPEWGSVAHRKRMEGYRRWAKDGNKVKFGNTSAAEREIASILQEEGVRHIRQFSPGKYRYDFCVPETNTIIEYNGTYWHADPRKYKEDYYNQKKGKTAKEMWDYDKKRVDFATEMGYTVNVVWEEDYKRLTKDEKRKLILESIKS